MVFNITANDIYTSPHYKTSLEISARVLKTMYGRDCPTVKSWSHCNHHIVTCIKMMYPELHNYVEIGTHYGHSLSTIINSGTYPDSTFVAIDLFDKNASLKRRSKYPSVLKVAEQNASTFNQDNKYYIIQGNSKSSEIVKRTIELVGQIDILYIDGDHSYKGVWNDFETYFSHMRSGGVIIFDDYLPHTRDSHKAINEIVEKYKEHLNIVGLLEDKVACNKVKPAAYLLRKNAPKKVYNMSYIIQKL